MDLWTSSTVGLSAVILISIVGVIAICVHAQHAKVASKTHNPKRHLRAGENYSRKHRVNSNRSIVSSNVSSNEDLTSYYEVHQLVVPTFYIGSTTNSNLVEENEISEDLDRKSVV